MEIVGCQGLGEVRVAPANSASAITSASVHSREIRVVVDGLD